MMSNCNCKYSCTLIAVIISAILGVVAALLRFTAVITVTPAFLWTLFGIAVGYLTITLVLSAVNQQIGPSCCTCRALNALLTGLLGTTLTSIILLGVTFAATSVWGAVVTGALIFFFALALISTACLIRCNYKCND